MNKLAIAALAACLAAPLSAGEQPMTVTANPTFSEWVSKISESLDRAMSTANLSRTEAGITYVRFTRGEDGRPQNISTMKAGPSQPNLDRVGRTVVRRIGTLPPMFRGARQNLTIEAAIIVARDADELHQLRAPPVGARAGIPGAQLVVGDVDERVARVLRLAARRPRAEPIA